jgi:hypothetical protein
MKIFNLLALSAVCAAAHLSLTDARAASFVTNGSFENGGPFVNDGFNYMELGAGSTVITGWTVAAGTSNNIVWGVNPTDGNTAADGSAFVDLSGFSTESSNGAIQQTLTTIPGQQYSFAFDYQGALSAVSIGSLSLILSMGPGPGQWGEAFATFVAPLGSQLLTIANASAGVEIVFVDNVRVTDAVVTPLPAALPLLATGLAGLGWLARRRRKPAA